MKTDIRLLILGGPGSRVRELRLSRRLLWLVALLPLVLFTSLGAFVLSVLRAPLEAASRASPRGALAQGLAPRLLPKSKTQAQGAAPCPNEMVLVAGDYCPNVKQECLRHLDPEGSVLRALRCAEYAKPSECLSPEKKQLRYCIDRDEYTRAGETRADNQHTFADAESLCRAQGKRLCSEEEWTFACEGEAMLPYPTGYLRDSKSCNIDREDLVTASGALRDLRASSGKDPGCASPFGVRNLTGNVEEFVVADDGSASRKGAYWQPAANSCRARRPHTDLDYAGVETGLRCCAPAQGS